METRHQEHEAGPANHVVAVRHDTRRPARQPICHVDAAWKVIHAKVDNGKNVGPTLFATRNLSSPPPACRCHFSLTLSMVGNGDVVTRNPLVFAVPKAARLDRPSSSTRLHPMVLRSRSHKGRCGCGCKTAQCYRTLLGVVFGVVLWVVVVMACVPWEYLTGAVMSTATGSVGNGAPHNDVISHGAYATTRVFAEHPTGGAARASSPTTRKTASLQPSVGVFIEEACTRHAFWIASVVEQAWEAVQEGVTVAAAHASVAYEAAATWSRDMITSMHSSVCSCECAHCRL